MMQNTPQPPGTKKIGSALAVFESNINKNKQFGCSDSKNFLSGVAASPAAGKRKVWLKKAGGGLPSKPNEGNSHEETKGEKKQHTWHSRSPRSVTAVTSVDSPTPTVLVADVTASAHERGRFARRRSSLTESCQSSQESLGGKLSSSQGRESRSLPPSGQTTSETPREHREQQVQNNNNDNRCSPQTSALRIVETSRWVPTSQRQPSEDDDEVMSELSEPSFASESTGSLDSIPTRPKQQQNAQGSSPPKDEESSSSTLQMSVSRHGEDETKNASRSSLGSRTSAKKNGITTPTKHIKMGNSSGKAASSPAKQEPETSKGRFSTKKASHAVASENPTPHKVVRAKGTEQQSSQNKGSPNKDDKSPRPGTNKTPNVGETPTTPHKGHANASKSTAPDKIETQASQLVKGSKWGKPKTNRFEPPKSDATTSPPIEPRTSPLSKPDQGSTPTPPKAASSKTATELDESSSSSSSSSSSQSDVLMMGDQLPEDSFMSPVAERGAGSKVTALNMDLLKPPLDTTDESASAASPVRPTRRVSNQQLDGFSSPAIDTSPVTSTHNQPKNTNEAQRRRRSTKFTSRMKHFQPPVQSILKNASSTKRGLRVNWHAAVKPPKPGKHFIAVPIPESSRHKPGKVTKEIAATRIQSVVRGGMARLHYRILSLEDRLHKVKGPDKDMLLKSIFTDKWRKIEGLHDAVKEDERYLESVYDANKRQRDFLGKDNERLEEQNEHIHDLMEHLKLLNKQVVQSTSQHFDNFATMSLAVDVLAQKNMDLTGLEGELEEELASFREEIQKTRRECEEEELKMEELRRTLGKIVDYVLSRTEDESLSEEILAFTMALQEEDDKLDEAYQRMTSKGREKLARSDSGLYSEMSFNSSFSSGTFDSKTFVDEATFGSIGINFDDIDDDDDDYSDDDFEVTIHSSGFQSTGDDTWANASRGG